jgi:ankyrin repeat protein
LLLNNGAEPNVEDKYGNTPLHWGINIWKKLYK